MSNKTALVCLFHGGKFVHHPMLEYIGGKIDLIHVNIDSMSYEKFVTDIENGVNGKFEKLYFKFPGKSLEDGLRDICNDSTVVDLVFYHLQHGLVEVYGESFDNAVGEAAGQGEGNGEGEGEGEGEGVCQGEAAGQGEGNGEGDGEGVCQGEDASEGNEVVVQRKGGLDYDYLVDESDYDDLEGDEFMIEINSKNEDMDPVDAQFLTDDDDDRDNEDLVEGRNKLKEFHRRATKAWIIREPLEEFIPSRQSIGESSNPQRSNLVIVESDHQTDYYETDGDESLGSDVGREDSEVTRRRSRYPRYDPDCTVPVFTTSMMFDDGRQFKDAVIKYSIVERREIKFIKNEKKFVRAKCADENCPWKISASFDVRTGSFHVKTYLEEHTCSISFNNKRVTSSWLAEHYLSTIKAMPTIKIIAFKDLIKEQLGLNISIDQCKKAKQLAFKVLMGNYRKEYAKLWDYAEELRETNPGSTVILKVEKPDMHSKALFERMYICFAACKKGFLDGCRKVVGLDGCFLKGICKGEILCAIGRDGNDQMFPIAWAVVRVESGDTWTWFLTNLMYDLNIIDTYGQGWVIISDKQKGLLQAVVELLPAAEHRMCARHIYANWGKKYKGIQMQRLFWKCAKSSTMVEFDEHAQALKQISPAAYHDLVQTEPKHWSRAFFTTDVKCDIVDNNLCEAFNGRIIEARCKSIYSMLEEMRIMIMTRMHTQRDACARWRRDYGPRIIKKLEANRVGATYCRVIWNGDTGYEVMDEGIKYVVDVFKRNCTCRRWQLTGIPCPHAISAIIHRQNDANDYVDEYYKKEKFLAAYQNMLMPVRGEKFWKKTNREVPEPLPAKVKPGRRKQKRRREEGEVVRGVRMSRIGMKMTCRSCSKIGHNSLTCPTKKAGTATSQTQLSRQKLSVKRHIGEDASGSVDGTPIVGATLGTPISHGSVKSTSTKHGNRQRVDIQAHVESTSQAAATEVPFKALGPSRKKKQNKRK